MFSVVFALNTKEIQKVRAILEYFRCMIGNTAEAWSYCSSRSDCDMLRVWFTYSPFVQSEHGVNVTAPLKVPRISNMQQCVGFEVLTAVSTKMAVFWVVAPCSLVEVYQRFRGPCCLHHQGDECVFWCLKE
jgi:hypothetical protein